MRVLRIVAEGMVTSFRYPHFMMQVQPTYEMPPPGTIYGHIASALGNWFDPGGVRFAYHFTYQGRVREKEHTHILKPATGKLPNTTIPKVLEGNVNPFDRELLFQPRLVLYLNRPDWEQAFVTPYYPVILGRSQDLFTYTDIRVIELEQAAEAYFEHTLLPYSANRYTSRGYAVLMPRYLDYNENRQPTFERYFIIRDRIDSRRDFLWFGERQEVAYWTDTTSPESDGVHLGLSFLSFVGDQDETFAVA